MKKIVTLTAAVAFALAFGFTGTAKAQFVFPFDGDLVGYWSFDDEADPTNDDSGKGHDGTLGANPTTGGTNAADEDDDPVYDSGDVAPIISTAFSLDFDGVKDTGDMEPDFVSIDDDSDFDLGTVASPDFTIAAWINTRVASSPFDAGFQYIVAKDGTVGRSYIFYLGSGPKLFASWFPGSGGQVNNLSGTTAIALNTWTHVALTYSYDSGTDKASVKTYVNGVVDQSTANGAGPITNTTTKINIARSTFFPSLGANFHRAFNGHIDDVRMYDVVLTNDEIKLLATGLKITKTLVDTTETNTGTAGFIDLGEEWAFEMKVTVEALGPGNLTDLKVKDPLPGDNEIGDGTSGTGAADPGPCLVNDPAQPFTMGEEPLLDPSQGSVTTDEKGKTDKCFVFWDIGDIDAGNSEMLTIKTSTDKNPGKNARFPVGHQEYTSGGPYCINQSAALSGTIEVNGTEIDFLGHLSNGLEIDNVGGVAKFDTNCDGSITGGTVLP